MVLVSGLALWNVCFIIYIVILAIVNTNNISNQSQIVVDLVCW